MQLSPWNHLVQLELIGQSMCTFFILMYLIVLSFRKVYTSTIIYEEHLFPSNIFNAGYWASFICVHH